MNPNAIIVLDRYFMRSPHPYNPVERSSAAAPRNRDRVGRAGRKARPPGVCPSRCHIVCGQHLINKPGLCRPIELPALGAASDPHLQHTLGVGWIGAREELVGVARAVAVTINISWRPIGPLGSPVPGLPIIRQS